MNTLITRFESLPTSSARARQVVATTLSGWQVEALIPVATLLASELVTNAVVHARSPVELRLERTGTGIRCEVFDESPTSPALTAARDEDTHGRGLELVDRLAGSWGIESFQPTGKTVWFELTG